ncbi:hypothetical protein ACYSNR_13935 [Enterococcus sp. LJL128]|uniref:hypothetical protein n=1 Tax=Enterococcus sp. LJL51 TaxID=3416656 RepID=UPI003CEA62B1
MSGKIAVIDQEFTQVAADLERSHQELLDAYEKIIELTKSLSAGALNTDALTPKIDGLMEGVSSDVIARLKELFTQTKTVIQEYETVIINVDTSC